MQCSPLLYLQNAPPPQVFPVFKSIASSVTLYSPKSSRGWYHPHQGLRRLKR